MQTNDFSHVKPNLSVEKPSSSKTGKALANSASFTLGAASLLHYKNSFTYMGVCNLFSSPSGSYHLEPIFGMLQLMAAPVQEGLRIGGGLTGVVTGAIATAVTAIAYSAECAGRAIFGGPQPEAKRKQLMEAFVSRMQDNLKQGHLPYEQEKQLFDNPGQLIGVTCVMIAFLSRRLEGRQIHTQKGVVAEKDMTNMDESAKKYFAMLCKMKHAMRNIQLKEGNEFLSWTSLMEKTQRLESNSNDVYENNEKAALRDLLQIADELSKSVVEDQMFIDAWKKQIPY